MNLSAIQQTMRDALERQRAGRFAEAETLYRDILARQPDLADAWHLLGILAGQAGRSEQALPLIRRAIAIDPANAEAYGNLGATLRILGRNEEAIAAYREFVRLRPTAAEIHGRLGELYLMERRFDEAVAACCEAIRLDPRGAQYHGNLGLALQAIGEWSEAVSMQREALRLEKSPGEIQYYNLGRALQCAGQFEEAIECHRRALELCPTLAEGYNNLANCYQALGDSDSAVGAYRSALQLQAASTEFRSNLSGALQSRGDIDEAVAALQEALELKPADPSLRSALIATLLFHPESDAASLRRESQIWHEQHELPLRPHLRPHLNDRSGNRGLRIGYVSADFRRHVIGQNLLPLLREHDREAFSIHCYANVLRPDAVTEEFREVADVWRNIVDVGDDAAAEIIRVDEVDILVDLTMHLAGNRLGIFARKPAPVQATYLAYCGSTGLEAIDYRLSDPVLDPPAADLSLYSEETVRLRRSYWCYQPLEACPEVGPLPAESAGHVTFGCLNNFAKVSPAALDLWLDVLEAVPGSRLLLSAPPGSCREKIRERFAARNLTWDRLEFVGKLLWNEYTRTFQRIDIALDPFPYGGGISTCDALWMGVPIVSGLGRMAVGRGGRSILTNIGMPELIADTAAQYIEIAAYLAGDLARLNALRFELRLRMKESPLRDAKGFARDVEAAFRFMWSKWAEHGEGEGFP